MVTLDCSDYHHDGVFPHHIVAGHIVDDVREVFDDLRRGVMESTAEMIDAVDRGRKKVYHAIAANNVIVIADYILSSGTEKCGPGTITGQTLESSDVF